MKRFKMECGCYYNGTCFKVGYKYLTLYKAGSGKIISKIELNDYIIKALKQIKGIYSSDDAERTYQVIALVDELEELGGAEIMNEKIRFYSDVDIYEYTFKTLEELKKFLEMYKDDKEEHFYYGDMDCFDGKLYSLEDLAEDVCDDWFSDDGLVHLYEF